MEAALITTLSADAAGCVIANTPGGNVTLVWPDGYSVTGDAASFDVVDGNGATIARSGVELHIGGGGGSSTSVQGNPDCAGETVWLVGAVQPNQSPE